MDYEAAAQERYREMCRIVGDVVFWLLRVMRPKEWL